MAATNLELVRKGYDAFRAGDLEAWLGLLDPEVEWRMAEDEPDRRTFRGQDGVLALLAENLELWSEISFDVEEVLELDEEWVLVVTTLRGVGKGSEVPIEQPESHLIRLLAGRAVRVEEVRHKADAIAAVRVR